MANISVVLKKNKVDERGEMPLYIRIIKNRKTKFISLKIKVHPDLWDNINHRVKNKFPNSTKTNYLIAKKLADAQGIALELEIKNGISSSKKIKEDILGKPSISFIKYMETYLDDLYKMGKMGTHDKVNATILKLKKYIKNGDLTFDEFDFDYLKKYERYLRDDLKNAPNTIHSNLKIFRKIFNDAVREGLIELQNNPFTKYKLSWEKTKKTYLTESELETIEQVELKVNSIQWHHRNMYVFAAYAGGLRISDLLQLRWRDYDGTHIKFFIQKTKDSISIKLPAKAREIIEMNVSIVTDRNDDDFIFPLLKNDEDYSIPKILHDAISSHTAHINKNLKEIAKQAQLNKHISFHSSRHTWATRALRKGMRIEYVSKLMGHASIRTTQGYTKIVNEDLDAAMNVFN